MPCGYYSLLGQRGRVLGRSGSYTNVLYLLCKSAMNQWVQSVHDGTKAVVDVGSYHNNTPEFMEPLQKEFPTSLLMSSRDSFSSSLSLRLQGLNSHSSDSLVAKSISSVLPFMYVRDFSLCLGLSVCVSVLYGFLVDV